MRPGLRPRNRIHSALTTAAVSHLETAKVVNIDALTTQHGDVRSTRCCGPGRVSALRSCIDDYHAAHAAGGSRQVLVPIRREVTPIYPQITGRGGMLFSVKLWLDGPLLPLGAWRRFQRIMSWHEWSIVALDTKSATWTAAIGKDFFLFLCFFGS
jgi:hypothetical protein